MGVSSDSEMDYHAKKKFVSGELNLVVDIARKTADSPVNVTFSITSATASEAPNYTLHWGIVSHADQRKAYEKPPPDMLPSNTPYRSNKMSVRTPFAADSASQHPLLQLLVQQRTSPDGILFLVYRQDPTTTEQRWFKRDGSCDFFLDLVSARSSAENTRRATEEAARAKEAEDRAREAAAKEAEAREREERERKVREAEELRKREEQEKKLAKERAEAEARKEACESYIQEKLKGKVLSARHDYDFGLGQVHFVCVRGSEDEDRQKPGNILVVTNMTLGGVDLLLHWGLKKERAQGWTEPPKDCRPPDTTERDGKAVQTPFVDINDKIRGVEIQNLPDGTHGLLAVLHSPPHQWYNKPGGGDMYIAVADSRPLPGLDASVSNICKEMTLNIVECEMEYGSWTLMHRYNHASHLINDTVGDDPDAWAAIYVWMRYSQLRVLDWQRNYNTQPRQLSSAQMNFVTLLAKRYRELPHLRWIIRMAMSCVGRGGSGDLGQRIRDDILHILRHHRGWGHGSMMEEWHQKLHNNTNPDDVVICDALMAFWGSFGNINEYRRVLAENGLTAERLRSYEQPIRAEPDYVPHIRDTMLGELGRYGHLLRQVHLGTDLHSSADHVRHYLFGDVRAKVDGYLHARAHCGFVDKLGAVAEARSTLRQQILNDHMNEGQVRDLVFLDLALEADIRREIEGGSEHDGSVWAHLKSLGNGAQLLLMSEGQLQSNATLENAAKEIFEVTDRISYYGESEDAGLRASAALTGTRNVLTDVVDRYKRYFGSLGEALGACFNASPETTRIFVEEAIRGGPAFSLSVMLRKAEPAVRRIARLGPYSVISPHYEEITGEVYVFNHLRESMGLELRPNSVIVANKCDGDEDVPEGCSYVIIGSTVDVLSHVAVRARNEHHGLIVCFDEDKMQELRNLEHSMVRAKLEGEIFVYSLIEISALTKNRSQESLISHGRSKSRGLVTPPSGLQSPRSFLFIGRDGGQDISRGMSTRTLRSVGRKASNLSELLAGAPWAIRPSEFTLQLVGGKSHNLARLNELGLPDWIRTPVSATIPNGSLKKVFRDPSNEALSEHYRELRGEIYAAHSTDVSLCPELRKCILSLVLPEGLAAAIRGILDELGCDDIDDSLPGAWEAIKGVWASLWNERAHLARRKLKMEAKAVDMAVLCQKIIDADYAFVIHTNNPITGAKDEIYGEIVVGLGETLVSNAPGQALGFTAKKDDNPEPVVKSYPSKPYCLRGGAYIFRSDSNAEDLEGFAGAGLHDSIPLTENVKSDIDYSNERLMIDDEFRVSLMRGVAKIGIEVERTMGMIPQDIEGCYKDGHYYVVQSRPQIV